MAAAISHNPITTAEPLAAIHGVPMDSSNTATGTSTASDTSSATISANDFLTLLVTEMKNQDPTATTDPNEYINQLVNVNSLEQLIDINQTLTSAYGSSSPYTAVSAAAQASSRPQTAASESLAAGPLSAPTTATQQTAASSLPSVATSHTLAGNLSIPASSPAAAQVAKSLNGDSRLLSMPGVSARR